MSKPSKKEIKKFMKAFINWEDTPKKDNKVTRYFIGLIK